MGKKITFFVSEFPTLSETFILDQITAAIDQGYQVDIIALRVGNVTRMHPNVEIYKLLDKVVYINLPRSFWNRGAFVLWSLLKHPIKSIKLLNIFKYGAVVWSLQPLLVWQKLPILTTDNIIAHYGNIGLIASVLREEGAWQGNLFTFFHGYDLTRTLRVKGNPYYQTLIHSDATLLPISHYFSDKLLALGANRNQIIVHHMGIDIDKHQPLPFTSSNSKKLNILVVARLAEKKGIHNAIYTVYILKNMGISVELTIIGEGEQRVNLEGKVAALGLYNEVSFKGAQSQEEVMRQLDACNIFLLPSITARDGDMEGIPVSLMEAMAHGKIVFSTNYSGIPELIDHGINGYLAEENQPQQLASLIRNYLSLSSGEQLLMSKKARNKVSEEFNNHMLNNRLFGEVIK